MNFRNLVIKARTSRHFLQEPRLTAQILAELLEYARISPSARNLQPLRYTLVHSPEACLTMRPMVTMGGAMKPEERPGMDCAPTGYIVIWAPEKRDEYCAMDVGIAAQSINLAAAEKDLACCMIGNFHKDKVRAWLMPEQEGEIFLPILVLALGSPAIERVIAPWESPGAMDGERRLPYFRDAQGVHCVPKRNLSDIILGKC